MDTIKTSDLKKYLSDKKLFISYDELEDMEKQLVNYQDKVVLRAVFEGIYGHDASELLNLTVHDIRGNKIRLKDDKYGERYVVVSDELISLIERAKAETEYYNKNGQSEGRFSKSQLMDSDYIIRGAIKNKIAEGKTNRSVIYNRFKMMKEEFEADYLSPNNVKKSGMIYMAYKLYKQYGVLENDQLAEIADYYNIQKIMNNNYLTYNYSILREYLNLENVAELYDIE
jgi:hypothetical protein